MMEDASELDEDVVLLHNLIVDQDVRRDSMLHPLEQLLEHKLPDDKSTRSILGSISYCNVPILTPIPLVAPVTTTCLPCSENSDGAGLDCSDGVASLASALVCEEDMKIKRMKWNVVCHSGDLCMGEGEEEGNSKRRTVLHCTLIPANTILLQRSREHHTYKARRIR